MIRRLHPVLLVAYLLLLMLFVIALYALATQDWRGFLMAGQAFLFSLTPFLLRWIYGIRTPHSMQAGVVLFMFATLFLGEVQNFYDRFWWWDLLFHFFAGLALGLIAYIVLILTYQKHHAYRVSALFTSVFAVSFSLAVGTVWEIVEFFTDLVFDTNMQPSIRDTMEDLLIGLLGALLSALYGFRYREHKTHNGISSIIESGVTKNKNTR